VCCCATFFLLFAGNSSPSSSSSPLLPRAAGPLLSLLLAGCLCFFGVRLVPPSASLLDYTFKVETRNTNTNIKHVSFIIAVQLMPQGYEHNKQDQTVMGLHVLTTVNTRLWSSFQSFELVHSTPFFFSDAALHHGVIVSNIQVCAEVSSSRATCQMSLDI